VIVLFSSTISWIFCSFLSPVAGAGRHAAIKHCKKLTCEVFELCIQQASQVVEEKRQMQSRQLEKHQPGAGNILLTALFKFLVGYW